MRGVVRDIQGNAEFILRKVLEERRDKAMPEVVEEGLVPDWMKPGFIRGQDIDAVLNEKEGQSGSQGRRLRTKMVEERDASRYAISVFYKQLSKTLISSRRRVGDSWLGTSGYLCYDWRETPVGAGARATYVSQSSLVMKFSKAAENVFLVTLDSIPLAATGGETEEEIAVIDAKNEASYAIVKSKLAGLMMEVEHDGLVKEEGQWVRTQIKRKVRFLGLAVQMLLTFTFGLKKERLFRTDSRSFKKISALACVLCRLMQEYNKMREKNGVDVIEDLSKVTVGSLSMDQLMPCAYRVREVIRKGGCLTYVPE